LDDLAANSMQTPNPEVGSALNARAQPRSYWLLAGLLSGGLLIWLFGPTLQGLMRVWDTEPDYSHGFLVAPFAAIMLWMRKDSAPQVSSVPGWGGLGLLLLSFLVRYAGERFFLTPLSGWALVLWLAGTCWLLAGYRMFVWAVPSLVFLLFMVPLPFRFEQTLSWQLQSVTTRFSTFVLQCLGQSAIAERHTIFLGDHVLEVEQACSGLRMVMGIAAVAFAFIVLNRRPWWEKVVIALAVMPVAMCSNAVRVVVTGLLMQTVSGEAAKHFSHDAAGWAMIVLAALLFGMLVAYLKRLIVQVEVESGRHLLRRPVSS
jgi:exosortase